MHQRFGCSFRNGDISMWNGIGHNKEWVQKHLDNSDESNKRMGLRIMERLGNSHVTIGLWVWYQQEEHRKIKEWLLEQFGMKLG